MNTVPIHQAVKLLVDWVERTPAVEIVQGERGLSLAFVGIPRSVGWVVVDFEEETFIAHLDRLRDYPPFTGRVQRRLKNLRTFLWTRGHLDGVPPMSLDEVATDWKEVENHLRLIVGTVREG